MNSGIALSAQGQDPKHNALNPTLAPETWPDVGTQSCRCVQRVRLQPLPRGNGVCAGSLPVPLYRKLIFWLK